jgi:hypothetical protein
MQPSTRTPPRIRSFSLRAEACTHDPSNKAQQKEIHPSSLTVMQQLLKGPRKKSVTFSNCHSKREKSGLRFRRERPLSKKDQNSLPKFFQRSHRRQQIHNQQNTEHCDLQIATEKLASLTFSQAAPTFSQPPKPPQLLSSSPSPIIDPPTFNL